MGKREGGERRGGEKRGGNKEIHGETTAFRTMHI